MWSSPARPVGSAEVVRGPAPEGEQWVGRTVAALLDEVVRECERLGTQALPIFEQQGSGVLINVGSLDSKLSEPYMSAYAGAKHGVGGFGMSLRQELVLKGLKHVSVCTVMPETIDTPFFQHAGNYTGRAIRAMPPVLSAERVAHAIVRMAQRPRREVFVGLAPASRHSPCSPPPC